MQKVKFVLIIFVMNGENVFVLQNALSLGLAITKLLATDT